MSNVTTIEGCVLGALPLMEAGSVHMCATSPPFWGLRDYGLEPSHWPAVRYAPMAGLAEVEVEAWTGQLGQEPSPEMYVGHLVEVFRLVRRVLRDDGTLWPNLGDSYTGSGKGGNPEGSKWKGYVGNKEREKAAKVQVDYSANSKPLPGKNLIGIPWRVAFALQADGWWLRSEIVWAKGVSFCSSYAGGGMPESVEDRPTRAHEQVFLLTKKARYYYDAEAVKEKLAPSTLADKRLGRVTGTGRDRYSSDNMGSCPTGMAGGDASGRNLRSVWLINPEPSSLAHYAGWPSRLVAPMIRAGTSEKGVCPKCAAPWERVVEKERSGGKVDPNAGNYGVPNGRYVINTLTGFSGTKSNRATTTTKTLGWRPTCSCEAAEPIPATVLDIFAGTGTTADVAKRLGRRCVLVDRSSAYVEMQRLRLAQQELF